MYRLINPKVIRYYSPNITKPKIPQINKPLNISNKFKSLRKTLIKSSTSNVYIAKKPLHGWEPMEAIMGPYFPKFFAMHCMVVIQEENSDEVFNFHFF